MISQSFVTDFLHPSIVDTIDKVKERNFVELSSDI